MAGLSPKSFQIHIDDDILADLRERLERTRWPDEVSDAGWTCGTDLAYLKDLVTYWRDHFDWRKQEVELNHFIKEETGYQWLLSRTRSRTYYGGIQLCGTGKPK